jgi:hypothetical protein
MLYQKQRVMLIDHGLKPLRQHRNFSCVPVCSKLIRHHSSLPLVILFWEIDLVSKARLEHHVRILYTHIFP